jgi:hypothetical protein
LAVNRGLLDEIPSGFSIGACGVFAWRYVKERDHVVNVAGVVNTPYKPHSTMSVEKVIVSDYRNRYSS